jgi:hypothetical protein
MTLCSLIFFAAVPRFCQQNAGFLAVAFHIYTTTTNTSTDFALFLILTMQKLHLNGFGPLLQHISYMFGTHNVCGLAVFSGNVDKWYGRLKEDGLVDSYGGGLKILFVTWPIFNNEIGCKVHFYGAYFIRYSNCSVYVRALAQL